MKTPTPLAVATLVLASPLSAQTPVHSLPGEFVGSFYPTLSQEAESTSLTGARHLLLDRAFPKLPSPPAAPAAVTLFFHGPMPVDPPTDTPLWETRPANFQVERLGADDLHVSQLVFSDVSLLVPDFLLGPSPLELPPGEKPGAVLQITPIPAGEMHSSAPAADVPEPSAVLLAAGAAAGLIRRRRGASVAACPLP